MRSLVVPFLLSPLLAQNLQVVGTTPAANRMHGVFEPVEIVFSAPVATASLSDFSVGLFGNWSGVVPVQRTLDASGTVLRCQPLRPWFPGEVVRVDLSRSITGANVGPLLGGHHFEFVVASGPGSGSFQHTQTLGFRLPGEGRISTYGIHAGDVDRDGSPDVTAVNEMSHDLRVFHNDGCTNFGPMVRTSDGTNWPSPHASADFDRDGWMDLVTGDYLVGNVSVFRNDGTGRYQVPQVLTGGSYIRSVAVGDFDGDGYPDIAAGNGGNVRVWRNLGGTGFAAPASYSGPNGSAEINVVDVDGDGHLDITSCNWNPGQVWVLIGNGDGTFTRNQTLAPVAGGAFASAAGDIDGDGEVDLVYACGLPNSLVWLFGDGSGGFLSGGSRSAGSGPTSLHLGDLEGDGDLDAVVSHYYSADFFVYLNDGTGNFGPPTVLPAVSGAACTTLADFDRDGDVDILGADEIVDVGLMFTQASAPMAGIQPANCGATLRLNQRADGAGFGGRAAVPVRAGHALSISVSGPPNALGLLAFGYSAPTAQPLLGLGLSSFDPTAPIVFVQVAPLDSNGELHHALAMPSWLPAGFTACLQGAVLGASSELLTNPMQFAIVP